MRNDDDLLQRFHREYQAAQRTARSLACEYGVSDGAICPVLRQHGVRLQRGGSWKEKH